MTRTICVVDDDPLAREMALSFLQEAGFEVLGFSSGDDAVRYLDGHASGVAVVFTDVQMPGGVDGIALANLVAAGWPWIKTLVTSGGGKPRRPLPPSAEFLPKPWRSTDLLARFRHIEPARLTPDA
jgi:CheY-like chemotaxis protein